MGGGQSWPGWDGSRELERAIHRKLPCVFPNGGRDALEKRIAGLRIGTNEALIAFEQARLRESLLAGHEAAMKTVANAYYDVYRASCSMLDRMPGRRLTGEGDLARIRDQIRLHLCTNSAYLYVHEGGVKCTCMCRHNSWGVLIDDDSKCEYGGMFCFDGTRTATVTQLEHVSMLRMIADLIVTEYERTLPACDV